MRISQTFEKAVRTKTGIQQQELVVTATTDNQGDFESYDDVEANLFIDGKLIGDISHLLSKAGVFQNLVDSINWNELAADTKILN